MPTFLMTDPAAFGVSYEINPWMKPGVWQADPAGHRRAAREAWLALKRTLESLGAQVEVLPGVERLPDMVFPANAAVVLDRKALVARFRHKERAGESAPFEAGLTTLKWRGFLDDVRSIEGVFQEGAGDCIWDAGRQHFWVGDGPRSSPEAAALIERYFGRQVVRLSLATDRYYHLDTCFCPLPGGEVLYHPPALTAEALTRLHALVPPNLRIEASAADAEAFSVNAVALGRTLVMATPPAALKQRLTARGYRVIALDLAPFLLSGGGAFCMTLRLDLAGAPAAALTA